MDDLKGIPEKDFEKLSKYLGREKALEYIKKEKYNYQAVLTKLLLLNLKDYAKQKPFTFWTLLIILLLFVGYFIFDTVNY